MTPIVGFMVVPKEWRTSLEAYGLPNGFAAVRLLEVDSCHLRFWAVLLWDVFFYDFSDFFLLKKGNLSIK